MKKFLNKAVSAVLSVAMITSMTCLSPAYEKNDKNIITDTGVSLKVPKTLNITQPASDITTSEKSYIIYGSSDPDSPVYLNGTEVTNRGIQGSFAATVQLSEGRNKITVKQGGNSRTVYITRNSHGSAVQHTKVTKAFPIDTQIVRSGDKLTLKCVAPSGSEVTAKFMGKNYKLKQNAATAVQGIAANFSAEITVPSVSKADNFGHIQYTMTNKGKTSAYTSEGELYVAKPNDSILVQSTETAAAVYKGDNTNSGIMTVLAHSTIDKVVDQNDKMYKLSMGGWIPKGLVKPLLGNYSHIDTVREVKTSFDYIGESYILKGNTYPPFITENTDQYLKVTLFNTKNVGSIPSGESEIFSDISVSQSNGNTVITFTKYNPKALWGYGVEYNKGETVIYCKKPPLKSDNPDKPLEGILVALDAGHGGSDPGALGVARLTGPVEKDLALATTIALQNRLESLGATVVMAREDDTRVYFNRRMNTAIKQRADFFISVHYNSAANANATGYEVYFYNEESKAFARAVENGFKANTDRNNRGILKTPFRVVLNTYCPSVLAEVEFLSSPKGYDSSCTLQNLYESANAMADAIINSL